MMKVRTHWLCCVVDNYQLHWSCKVAKRPLCEALPRYGKKWFSGKEMKCMFCKKKGHDVDFCPSKPYEAKL